MTTIPFDNSYATLPPQMFTALAPTPVSAPSLIAANDDLASVLGIDPAWLQTPAALSVFAGNAVPDGATPIAQLYAGHQFGHWNPQLGDGRAILLGEVIGTDGIRRDIQLKGAGRTPYSRSGDGRAWLGPVMREYLVSEAMHAMGIPTTRALAATLTGDTVVRETMLPGAILTRVAQSHIRVGTFQVFASRGDLLALQALTDHVIARHYPDATGPSDLLRAVTARQAHLIAKWMGVGFIHGVMNTDNAAISGETIDYGPCAFMDAYHPNALFSSIDQNGRYAFQNQPNIGVWNMAQLATSLVPLMPDSDVAVTEFTEIINGFGDLFQSAWREVHAGKLGLKFNDVTGVLITDLLTLMAQDQADFTNVFATLMDDAARDQFIDRDAFDAWKIRWLAQHPDTQIMAQSNPQIIPRNHQIEAAIQAGVSGDLGPFNALLAAVTSPFSPLNDLRRPFSVPPTPNERVTQTFCGT